MTYNGLIQQVAVANPGIEITKANAETLKPLVSAQLKALVADGTITQADADVMVIQFPGYLV